MTIHGTNAVLVQGNVGFNVHGHCYYLEDGVEERNVLDRNLAAYVHPIQTAGSGGGQQVRAADVGSRTPWLFAMAVSSPSCCAGAHAGHKPLAEPHPL